MSTLIIPILSVKKNGVRENNVGERLDILLSRWIFWLIFVFVYWFVCMLCVWSFFRKRGGRELGPSVCFKNQLQFVGFDHMRIYCIPHVLLGEGEWECTRDFLVQASKKDHIFFYLPFCSKPTLQSLSKVNSH